MRNWSQARSDVVYALRNLAEAAIVPVVVTGFFLGSFYGVATAIYYSERYECGQVTVNTGTATKFVKNHLLSWDCYASVDEKWIPLDKWRGDSD